jgi:hypothetical protein
MAAGPDAEVVSVDVALRPDELIQAWRADSRRLLLPAPEPLPLRRRVAARIRAVGRGVAATITGRVARAGRHGEGFRIELEPDELRVRAVERLLEIARGMTVAYQPRAPRFLATMPAVVQGPAGNTYMNTFSVSENGCGLAWSGPLPAVGAALDVRLGAGNRTASFRGAVCWTGQSGRAPTVGVRFLSGAQAAWKMMFAELRRTNAPPA